MDFEILHKGQNIVDSIKVSRCFSCDRYGGTLDDLTISFATDECKVEFNENDELEVRTAGGFTTGVMYLDSCEGNDGRFTLKALSCRHKNKKRKSKIWNQVKLSHIASDVAKNTALTPLFYGVDDYTYKSVSQINETDLQLLARLCKREGYSIKCDNGNLIIFNEHFLESNSKPIEIPRDAVSNNFSFSRNPNGLSSVTVRYYDTEEKHDISCTATDRDVSGGDDNRIEFLSNISEGQRFCVGYLREANKFNLTGILEMPYNGNISAGTVADLTGFSEFDGRYVVYEARHDFVLEKTTVYVRKILNY